MNKRSIIQRQAKLACEPFWCTIKADGSWMVTFPNQPTSPRIWNMWLAQDGWQLRIDSSIPTFLILVGALMIILNHYQSEHRFSCSLNSHICPHTRTIMLIARIVNTFWARTSISSNTCPDMKSNCKRLSTFHLWIAVWHVQLRRKSAPKLTSHDSQSLKR